MYNWPLNKLVMMLKSPFPPWLVGAQMLREYRRTTHVEAMPSSQAGQ
jgi:hypothetical protein